MFEVVFSAEQRDEPGELCAVFPPAVWWKDLYAGCMIFSLSNQKKHSNERMAGAVILE